MANLDSFCSTRCIAYSYAHIQSNNWTGLGRVRTLPVLLLKAKRLVVTRVQFLVLGKAV